MDIKDFKVEQWMNAHETECRYNIAETCVDSVSANELFDLVGEDEAAFWAKFAARRLTYGDIEGRPDLLDGIRHLYKTITPSNIIPTHGAAGANALVISTLVLPGDHVVSVMPTYQQLYSIPEACGAKVDILRLRQEEDYLPDLDELRRLVGNDTKLICINNPDNPTGALMDSDTLGAIVDIAKAAGAWVLCDEVYRHLTQEDVWIDSIVDLYDKGISVSSMSKVFSLAGLRLGWVVTKSAELRRAILAHRDYNLISCGLFDEELAAVALRHADRLLERNRGIVRTNLAILDSWIKGEPHLSYTKPQGGTTTLVYWDLGIDSVTFCEQLLEETGALVTPGDCFEEERCMRIGYASDTQELKDGLAAISRFVASRA